MPRTIRAYRDIAVHGGRLRLDLAPAPHGQVLIVSAYRELPGHERAQRVPRLEGTTAPASHLHLDDATLASLAALAAR